MSETLVFQSTQELQSWRKQLSTNLSIGFVPTMGALHEGHATLLRQAKAENDIVVLSIFINPTQFNDANDLAKYPRTWDDDLKLAKTCGVSVVFAPQFAEMYPDHYRYKVSENQLSTELCGAHRPGHFDGVLTVVMKLFNLVQPGRAYFGEKDYQQLSLIRDMTKAFFMSVSIVPVSTMREVDGLAMSSRNRRLSPENRKLAPALHRIISAATTAEQAHALLLEQGFDVDYVRDIDNRRFAAAKLGEVRLIDNVEISL